MQVIQNIGSKKSRQVTESDMDRVKSLIPKMHQLCNNPLGEFKNGAYAIAHCQVDQEDPLRFFVMQDGSCVVNPFIKLRIGETFRHEEGCMSFADAKCLLGVDRYRNISVSFLGISFLDGKWDCEECEMMVSGLLSCIFQHEIDHMDGKHIYS